MTKSEQPLVSVLTPVYNGEAYVRECIESVIAQTYTNWEYIIVNNCSRDRTLELASEYTRDPRIRVETNPSFLPIIANHNRAFSLISPDSKYCKVVSADDWLFPEALSRLVEVAENHPSIGLVGSYQLSGGNDTWYVRNYGLPYNATFVKGRDMCRMHTLAQILSMYLVIPRPRFIGLTWCDAPAHSILTKRRRLIGLRVLLCCSIPTMVLFTRYYRMSAFIMSG